MHSLPGIGEAGFDVNQKMQGWRANQDDRETSPLLKAKRTAGQWHPVFGGRTQTNGDPA